MYNTYAIVFFVAMMFSAIAAIELSRRTMRAIDKFDLGIASALSVVMTVVLLGVALHYVREATFAQQSPLGWVMKRWADSVF